MKRNKNKQYIRYCIWIVLIVLVVLLLYVLWSRNNVSTATASDVVVVEQSATEVSIDVEKSAEIVSGDTQVVYEFDADEDMLPLLNEGCASQIISHTAYTLSYNGQYKVPNWVCYELTREELEGDASRSNRFVPDPDVAPAESATLSDYSKSGFDRGHIAPAADFNWSKQAKDESFYLSNMAPQRPSFNRGIWKRLEDRVRFWADRDSAICVVAGPVLPASGDEYERIGTNQVLVPELFYKVVACFTSEGARAVAFVMPNEGSDEEIWHYAVSVDSVEHLTGIDFFYTLPDSIECAIEQSYTLSDWF